MIEKIGLIAGILLPLWNIPLIVHIGKRRSSKDVSLWWTFGVWICYLAMLPAALVSADVVFRVFMIVSCVLATMVVVQVMRFR